MFNPDMPTGPCSALRPAMPGAPPPPGGPTPPRLLLWPCCICEPPLRAAEVPLFAPKRLTPNPLKLFIANDPILTLRLPNPLLLFAGTFTPFRPCGFGWLAAPLPSSFSPLIPGAALALPAAEKWLPPPMWLKKEEEKEEGNVWGGSSLTDRPIEPAEPAPTGVLIAPRDGDKPGGPDRLADAPRGAEGMLCEPGRGSIGENRASC